MRYDLAREEYDFLLDAQSRLFLSDFPEEKISWELRRRAKQHNSTTLLKASKLARKGDFTGALTTIYERLDFLHEWMES